MPVTKDWLKPGARVVHVYSATLVGVVTHVAGDTVTVRWDDKPYTLPHGREMLKKVARKASAKRVKMGAGK